MIWTSTPNTFTTDKSSSKPEEPPTIDTTFLDGRKSVESLKFIDKNGSGTFFHAEAG
jgi:hypothetical protein